MTKTTEAFDRATLDTDYAVARAFVQDLMKPGAVGIKMSKTTVSSQITSYCSQHGLTGALMRQALGDLANASRGPKKE